MKLPLVSNLLPAPGLAWWHEHIFEPVHHHGGGFAAGVLVLIAIVVVIVLLARPTAP